MQYSVLINKDQQKMVVKLFFLYSQINFFFEFFIDEFIGDESDSVNIAI